MVVVERALGSVDIQLSCSACVVVVGEEQLSRIAELSSADDRAGAFVDTVRFPSAIVPAAARCFDLQMFANLM